MKKETYLKNISEKLGLPKNLCNNVIEAYLEELAKRFIETDKVSITNIGTFQKTLIKPKNFFSPIDGSSYNKNEYYRITFSCSANLMNKLKK